MIQACEVEQRSAEALCRATLMVFAAVGQAEEEHWPSISLPAFMYREAV